MKEWGARFIEALEVQGMREAIISAGTKFQLGGKTGMRVQFHIYVVKSVMAMVEEKKTGEIIYTADIKKFFDKEVLVDCMDVIAKAQVDPKVYMNWYQLNQRCQVAVVTGAGMSEEGDAGEVVGQGSRGAALVSQLKVDKVVDSYFSGSTDEECYGGVRLQPLSWQDDLLGMAEDASRVQASMTRLAYAMAESQLTVHPDKSGYIMYGKKKYREQVSKETEEDPVKFGDIPMKKMEQMKYLGDMLHEDGLTASVDATVMDRMAKVKGSIFELKALCEDYRLQICGGMMGIHTESM